MSQDTTIWWSIKCETNRTRNPINTEWYKETEHMEIVINPHGTIVCMEWTYDKTNTDGTVQVEYYG